MDSYHESPVYFARSGIQKFDDGFLLRKRSSPSAGSSELITRPNEAHSFRQRIKPRETTRGTSGCEEGEDPKGERDRAEEAHVDPKEEDDHDEPRENGQIKIPRTILFLNCFSLIFYFSFLIFVIYILLLFSDHYSFTCILVFHISIPLPHDSFLHFLQFL